MVTQRSLTNRNEFNLPRLLKTSLFISISVFLVGIGFYIYFIGSSFSNKSSDWADFSSFAGLLISICNLIIISVITWSIFLIQEQNSKRKELERIQKLKVQKLEYIYYLSLNSIKYSKQVSLNLKSLIEDFKKDLFDIPRFYLASSNELNLLVNVVNQEEVYHAYVENIGSDKVNKIFEVFYVLHNQIELLKSDFEKYNFSDHDRKSKAISILEEAKESIHLKLSELRKRKMPEFDQINSIFLKYLELENSSEMAFSRASEQLLLPILYYLQGSGKLEDDYFHEMTLKISKANKNIYPILAHNEKYCSDLKMVQESLEEFLEAANESIVELEDFLYRK